MLCQIKKRFKMITPAGLLGLLTLLVLLAGAILVLRSMNQTRESYQSLRTERYEMDRRLVEELGGIYQELARQDGESSWLYGEIQSLSTEIAEVKAAKAKMPKLPPAMRWSFDFEPPPLSDDDEHEIERVGNAVLHYVKKAPRRKLAKDEEYRKEFATDIFYAATAENVSHILVAILAFKESSYRTEAVGGRGEIGLMQVHGKATNGCDLTSRVGQLQCGSRWLGKAYEKCGTWQGALSAYASGNCKPQSHEVWEIVTDRLGDWMDLESTL